VAIPAQGGSAQESTNPAAAGSSSSRPSSRPTTKPGSSNRSTASRSTRRRTYQPTFRQRHRNALLAIGGLAVIAVLGGFFFLSATASAYTCGTITQPQPSGTPLPNGSPAPLGQAQPDMGNLHVTVGTVVHYAYCPPASGQHYNNPGVDGPIPAKFYGPDAGVVPQNWIHNLEHGAVVVLYNCNMGGCTSANLAALQQIPVDFPDSPVCGIKGGVLAPVVARFDSMAAPFAALVWNRLLYMNTVDKNLIEQFYATEGETTNPEAQCARPTASPSAAPSTSSPVASPPASETASPAVQPTVSPSPAPSAAPTASPS
jgi:Protein of unknown function (DUF3105)